MTSTAVVMTGNNAAVVDSKNFDNAMIDAFVASKHIADNSKRTYRNALRRLFEFFAAESVTMPTEESVMDFINKLAAQKKAAATIRLYTTTVKNFFSWTARKGYYPNVAADVRLNLKKSTTHNKKALSQKQAQDLLSAVKGNTLIALRDRAIIALALQTGVRTVEIERANIGDLYSDGSDWYLDVQGKGRIQKDATVRIAPQTAKLILRYLDLRGEADDDASIFVSTARNSSRGKRLSAQSVGKLIKAYMKSVGIVDKKNHGAFMPALCGGDCLQSRR